MRPNGKLPLPLPTPPGATNQSAARAGATSANSAARASAARITLSVYRLARPRGQRREEPLRVEQRNLRAQPIGQEVEGVLGPRDFEQRGRHTRLAQAHFEAPRE